MDWIEIEDGYVRKDAIIDVHINKSVPEKVMLLLISGDSVCYKECADDIEAIKVLNKLMVRMVGIY